MNYPDKSSQSFALNQRAQRSLPGGNTRTTVFAKPYPLYAARAQLDLGTAFGLPNSS